MSFFSKSIEKELKNLERNLTEQNFHYLQNQNFSQKYILKSPVGLLETVQKLFNEPWKVSVTKVIPELQEAEQKKNLITCNKRKAIRIMQGEE